MPNKVFLNLFLSPHPFFFFICMKHLEEDQAENNNLFMEPFCMDISQENALKFQRVEVFD